jgi:AcrR family transcriptional regulator
MRKTYARSYVDRQLSWDDDVVSTTGETGTTDGRLLRGDRSRRTIARHAVDVASTEGLEGVSIGRLASDLGVSKGGVQTLFGTKERLQLAAVDAAREAFHEAVVAPALRVPRGAARLRALVEHWIRYVEAPLFPGGCFWTATLAEFDSRPGAVRDALRGQHQDWLDLLAGELAEATRAREIDELDTALAAFQIDAVLTAANVALRMGDAEAVDMARRVVAGLLGAARR